MDFIRIRNAGSSSSAPIIKDKLWPDRRHWSHTLLPSFSSPWQHTWDNPVKGEKLASAHRHLILLLWVSGCTMGQGRSTLMEARKSERGCAHSTSFHKACVHPPSISNWTGPVTSGPLQDIENHTEEEKGREGEWEPEQELLQVDF